MKDMSARVLVIMLFMILFACGSSSSLSTTDESQDSVSITSISPESAVAGKSTSFTVEVSYSLASKESGLLYIGFNSDEADSYLLISGQTHTVAKGSGTHAFTVTTIPVDWESAGEFQTYVNLSENPHPESWMPLASDTKTIATGPGSAGALEKVLRSADYSVSCVAEMCF